MPTSHRGKSDLNSEASSEARTKGAKARPKMLGIERETGRSIAGAAIEKRSRGARCAERRGSTPVTPLLNAWRSVVVGERAPGGIDDARETRQGALSSFASSEATTRAENEDASPRDGEGLDVIVQAAGLRPQQHAVGVHLGELRGLNDEAKRRLVEERVEHEHDYPSRPPPPGRQAENRGGDCKAREDSLSNGH
ncbi:MAG: hypothetical protein [Microviridae sp.]|nr:MAG: hypothetical protein [Microviridae sp.]